MSLDDAIKKAIGVKYEKALVSGDEGDFIPKEYADDFIGLVREKNWCRQLFTSIKMTTAVMYIPKVSGDANVYYVSTEATAPAASVPTFAAAGSVTLTAKKLMAYATISNEADEDAKIAMMPLIKESFASSLAKGEEECMINGQFFGAFSGTDRRKAFPGLMRLAALASQTVAYATSLTATVESARRKLGVHGRDVKDLVLMVNSYTASALRDRKSVV